MKIPKKINADIRIDDDVLNIICEAFKNNNYESILSSKDQIIHLLSRIQEKTNADVNKKKVFRKELCEIEKNLKDGREIAMNNMEMISSRRGKNTSRESLILFILLVIIVCIYKNKF